MSSIRSRTPSIIAVFACGPLQIGRLGIQPITRLARKAKMRLRRFMKVATPAAAVLRVLAQQHDMVTEFQT